MDEGHAFAPGATTDERDFERLGGACAIVAAVIAPIYSVAFVVLKSQVIWSLGLLAGGLLTVVALMAVYRQLRTADAPLAQLGLLFGFIGAMGTSIHGGYELANVAHVPTSNAGDLPFPVDPRGLLTFGVSALGLLALLRAALKSDRFPRGLSYLGLLLVVLLIVIYLGRLIVYDAGSPLIVAPAALAGLIVSPAWLAWVGYLMVTGRGTTSD